MIKEKLVFCLIVLAIGSLILPSLSWAQEPTEPTIVSEPVTPIVMDKDLRELPKAKPWKPGDPIIEIPLGEVPPYSVPGTEGTGDGFLESLPLMLGGASVTPAEFLTPNPNFPGLDVNGSVPPDSIGDVGPNHYVHMVNTLIQIYDKQGNPLLLDALGNPAPVDINSLWASTGFPGVCSTRDDGDPVVVYDHLSDRWLISQFANPNGFQTPPTHECIAISRTPNPVTGGWYLYDFTFNFGHDYPKIGVWPDAYYMSSQQGFPGGNLNVVAFDRANMLNGNPATFQPRSVAGPALILLPSDLDGPPPPPGTPNFFTRHVDGDQWGGSDRVEIWEFSVNWQDPAQSSIAPVAFLPTVPFDSNLCNIGNLQDSCVPQPGTGQLLATLPHWAMWRAQFRQFSGHQTLVFNHTVDVDGTGHAGIRWYELRNVGGVWSIFQQGTYSPDGGNPGLADDVYRWMGSVAMDKDGNMALGYSVSSSTVFPSIRYAGRLSTDPLGLMPHGEATIFNGTASQTYTHRWGDYSSMNVDPVDDCTFWYTTEYIPTTDLWRTQIAAFRFPSCNATDLAITKTASPDPATAGGQLIYTVTVTNNGLSNATNVQVSDTLPSGVTFMTDTDSCVEGPVGTLTCDVGDIASGDTVSFQIKVLIAPSLTASGPTSITNTATVSADQQELDDTNNTVSVTTIVDEAADLRLTKECKPDSPIPTGRTATCTIFVDNLGPSDARNVVVTDTHLSNGNFTITSATFTPPSASSCSISAGAVTCNLGTEPAGGRTTITIKVTSNEQVDVNDTATVISDTSDPDASNNIGKGKITFTGVADLSVTKTDIPDPVVAGTNLTYTITVINNGPSTAPNVIVKDVMPAQVSMISFTPGQGSCNGGVPGDPLQPLTCNLDTLTNGGSATITVVVRVNPSTPEGTILVNNTVVSSDYADPNNGNNNVTASTTVQARADLSVTKTSDKNVYKPSTLISYTVTVANNGHSDAMSVVVTDNLPPIKQALYKSDTGGCTKVANTLTCNMGNMAVGTSKSFNIYLVVKGSRGQITNTASVSSSTIDPVPANNSSTKVVTIGGK